MLTIKRVSIVEEGCFGVMLLRGIPFALTLERTYEIAGPKPTKIPAGIYRCTKSIFIKGNYATYEIHVPGHDRILFHKGNVEEDFDGCIGIGEQFGMLGPKPAILQSGAGFEEFMRRMEDVEFFDLTIE